jgi:hypothetical protein
MELLKDYSWIYEFARSSFSVHTVNPSPYFSADACRTISAEGDSKNTEV